MSLSLAKLIREAINSSTTDVKFRSDYSGRAMYGRRCIGIVGTWQECHEIIGAVAHQLLDHVFDGAMDSEDEDLGECCDAYREASVIMKLLHDIRTDSMGLTMIVYWPKVEDLDENGDMNEVDEDIEE